MSATHPAARRGGDGLADVLERVLDKGIVIAGDIQIRLLDIDILTIKVRLLVASVDTARSMGIDWWEHDRHLTGGADAEALEQRIDRLERAVVGSLAAADQRVDEPIEDHVAEAAATHDRVEGDPADD